MPKRKSTEDVDMLRDALDSHPDANFIDLTSDSPSKAADIKGKGPANDMDVDIKSETTFEPEKDIRAIDLSFREPHTPTPQKMPLPGRPRGSGANESRKKVEEYSQSKNAQSKRRKKQALTGYEAEMDRAKKTDKQAIWRAKKNFQASPRAQAMSEEEKKIEEKQIEEQVMQKRHFERRSKESLEIVAKLNSLCLDDKHEADTQFVDARRQSGRTKDFQEEEFWDDVDEEGEELNDVDIVAGCLDGLHLDSVPNEVGNWEEDFPADQTIRVAKSSFLRREHRKAVASTVDRLGWRLFRDHWHGTYKGLLIKLTRLEMMGDLVIYNPMNKQQVLGVGTKWAEYVGLTGHTKAHHFFSHKDRGALRALIGALDEEWYDLPGPSEWWPDNETYYTKHGFEPRRDKAAKLDYGTAFRMLGEDEPPEGWMRNMVHENARYDLIWRAFFYQDY